MKWMVVIGAMSAVGPSHALARGGAAVAEPRTLEYERSGQSGGITIKAPSAVDPLALERAAGVIGQMLDGREDIGPRLVGRGASVAIIPRDRCITALPEFAALSGRNDPNGNPYDSFAVRGAGAVVGQPVTATAEENLLRLPGKAFATESIAHHEFAHAIMNLGFTEADHRRWRAIYGDAVEKRLFPGTFAMTSADEYWAELSQSYFSVNQEINGPQAIRERDPAALAFLEEVYGRSTGEKNEATAE